MHSQTDDDVPGFRQRHRHLASSWGGSLDVGILGLQREPKRIGRHALGEVAAEGDVARDALRSLEEIERKSVSRSVSRFALVAVFEIFADVDVGTSPSELSRRRRAIRLCQRRPRELFLLHVRRGDTRGRRGFLREHLQRTVVPKGEQKRDVQVVRLKPR
jgi:hypothetical protein